MKFASLRLGCSAFWMHEPSRQVFYSPDLGCGLLCVKDEYQSLLGDFAASKFKCDYTKTLATCRCRPTHMRKAGRKPQWITEEAPAK